MSVEASLRAEGASERCGGAHLPLIQAGQRYPNSRSYLLQTPGILREKRQSSGNFCKSYRESCRTRPDGSGCAETYVLLSWACRERICLLPESWAMGGGRDYAYSTLFLQFCCQLPLLSSPSVRCAGLGAHVFSLPPKSVGRLKTEFLKNPE